MRRLPIILTMLVALFFASCQMGVEPETKLVPPASYLQLVDKFNKDAEWIGAKKLSATTMVFFMGKKSLAIPTTDFDIADCSGGLAPEQVSYDSESGHWAVGGKLTSIPLSTGSLSASYPVYAYFNETELKVFASNGDFFGFELFAPEQGGDDDDEEGEEDPKPDPDPEPEPPRAYSIPRIDILTDGGKRIENKTDYVPGTIKVTDPNRYFSDVDVFEARMKIRGRGNTTWHQPKHPYKIKLDEKAKILGMHKDREWVLLANHFDKTLLRNIVAMEISRRLGFSWTPTMISAEVYLNHEYVGLYVFTEHKKVSKHRVNIEVATPEDNTREGLTGGFYLELENESMNEPCWFKTAQYGVTFMFHEPENPTPEQQAYLENYVASFEACLFALGHDDRGPKNYYDYIDVDSFVRYYIIEELTQNGDGNFRKSTFLTKERGKKLELYHVWDFDLTLGNSEQYKPYEYMMRYCVWNNRLFGKNDELWISSVKKKWAEVYEDLETIPDYMDEQIRLFDGAQDRNFEKWPVLGIKLGPNPEIYGSYEGEVEHLKKFYNERLKWLDNEIRNNM